MPALIVSPVTSSSGGFSVNRDHAAVVIGIDQPIAGRVHDAGHDDGGFRLLVFVITDDVEQVGVGKNVAVQDDCRIVDQVFGRLESARSAPRQVFMGVAHGDPVLHAVTEDIGDLAGLVGEAQDYFGDMRLFYVVYLEKQKRNVCQWHDRLRRVQGQRPQTRPLPAGQYECLNHDLHPFQKHISLSHRVNRPCR